MDDLTFLAAFEARTLTRDDWTHRAHIRAGWLALQHHPFAEALPWIRQRISSLNVALGNQNTATSGYHETITCAFLRLIDSVRRHHGAGDTSAAFADAQPELMNAAVLRLYYTRDRIFSVEARARFMEPDLAPFPR